jgi:hypothetical protein
LLAVASKGHAHGGNTSTGAQHGQQVVQSLVAVTNRQNKLKQVMHAETLYSQHDTENTASDDTVASSWLEQK